MPRCRRIADIAPRRKLAVLILKDAFEHQKFFAAAVCMGGESAAGRVANDGGGSRYLIADAVQHAPFDAGHWRWHPGEPRGVDSNPREKSALISMLPPMPTCLRIAPHR